MSGGAIIPAENTCFSEDTLLREIEKVWGRYGAHADLYRYILMRLKAAEVVLAHVKSPQAGPDNDAYWDAVAHYVDVRDNPAKHLFNEAP